MLLSPVGTEWDKQMASSVRTQGDGPQFRELRALANITQQVPHSKKSLDPIPGGLWNPLEEGPGSSAATCPQGVTEAQRSGWEVPAARTCLYWSSLPRLLEADSKSMRSMNGSRRNSGSSLVSSSSASSNLSHLEEDTWILWGRIANEWEEWRRRKEKLLKVAGMVEVGGHWGTGW